MRTNTRAAWAALLTFLLLTTGKFTFAASVTSIAYVAQIQGAAMAQTSGSAPRALERFSPLFAGDVLTIADSGKVTARYVSTGQTQTYTPTDPPAQRRVAAPAAPSNDVKSRLLRAVFDDQRAGLAKASRNRQAAVRALGADDPLKAVLPRKETLRHNLTFTWQMTTPEPARITIYDSDNHLVWESEDVKENHLAYPADAPGLKPEKTYHWIVSRSKTEMSTSAEFKIASANVEKEVTRRLEMLKRIDFADAEEAGVTIAAMLIKSELYSNALQSLARLTEIPVSPLVHVLRFQAYESVGLKDFAKDEKDAQGKSGDAIKAQWQQAEVSP